jgi:protein-S-isoprenylcysteine O-methyltransferase Ste14
MRQLLVLGSATAYFALAILGEGGFVPFARPALAAVAAAYFAIVGVSMFAGGNVSSGEREDRTNRWVLIPFSIVGLALGFVPAFTDRIGFLTLDGDAIRWAGIALFIAGASLRLWPVFVLGNRFSGLVAIQHEHRLVTTGIYGVIRNPSYAGLLVYCIGWSLAFRSGAGLILTALLVPPLVARMRSEEALLASHFGAEYDAYRKRTSRLIPGIY